VRETTVIQVIELLETELTKNVLWKKGFVLLQKCYLVEIGIFEKHGPVPGFRV